MNPFLQGRARRKASKYQNQKVRLDGYLFDSIAEAARYVELRDLVHKRQIADLRMQVVYPLVASIKYIGDFEYRDATGKVVTEDVKGRRTAVYMLKRKLFRHFIGRAIVEVKVPPAQARLLVSAAQGVMV